MLDTTTQTIAASGTPQLVTFNTTVKADKVAVTSSSRFTFNEAGFYTVLITTAVTDTASANKTLDLWLRVNGSDVTNSNTKVFITNSGDLMLTTISMSIIITAGQYIELWANGDSTTLALPATAAGVTPTRPVTPSIFLTINRIHP